LGNGIKGLKLKKLFVFIILILVSVSVYSADLNPIKPKPIKEITNNGNAEINNIQKWEVVSSNDIGYKVDIKEPTNPNSEICLYSESAKSIGDIPLTKEIYNEKGILLDVKTAQITSLSATATYGYCYTPSETYFKFGSHSTVLEYQNKSTILYQYDWGNTSITLLKEGLVNNDIYVYANADNGYKFGANDTILGDGELANYTYVITSTSKLVTLEKRINYNWVEQIYENKTRYIQQEKNTTWYGINESGDTGEVYYEYYNETVEEIYQVNIRNVTHADIDYIYPDIYNYYPNGFNELRHWYDFEDICKKEYANCNWVANDYSVVINFISDRDIDPIIENVSGCATLNQYNTTYILNQSITDISGDCFAIENDSITLDLNGFTIDGANETTTYGVVVLGGYDNFTLEGRAGHIDDFAYAVGIYQSNNNLIRNFTANSDDIKGETKTILLSEVNDSIFEYITGTSQPNYVWADVGGIFTEYGNRNIYRHNTFYNLVSEAFRAVGFNAESETNSIWRDNYIQADAGMGYPDIYLYNCYNISILSNTGNTGEFNTWIESYASYNIQVHDNIPVGSDIVFDLGDSAFWNITNNSAREDIWGIGDFINIWGFSETEKYNHTITPDNEMGQVGVSMAKILYNYYGEDLILGDEPIGYIACYYCNNMTYQNIPNAPTINVEYFYNSTLRNLTSNWKKISISYAENINIENVNLSSDNDNAIYLQGVTNVNITNASIWGIGSSNPLYFSSVSNARVENLDIDSKQYPYMQMYVGYLNNLNIKVNQTYTSYGLSLYGNNITINNSFISGGSTSVLSHPYLDYLTVENTELSNSPIGLYLYSNGLNLLVEGNLFRNVKFTNITGNETYLRNLGSQIVSARFINASQNKSKIDPNEEYTMEYNIDATFEYYLDLNITDKNGVSLDDAIINITKNNNGVEGYCYQDQTNIKTCEGTLDSGSYSLATAYYVTMTYAKPSGLSGLPTWIVDYGNLGVQAIEIPQDCMDYDPTYLYLRVHASINDGAYSRPACRGLVGGWQWVGAIVSTSTGGWYGYYTSATHGYDIYNTKVGSVYSAKGIFYYVGGTHWVKPQVGNVPTGKVTLWEEGMLWDFGVDNEIVNSSSTDKTRFELPAFKYIGETLYNLSNYTITVSKDGYYTNITSINFTDNLNLQITLEAVDSIPPNLTNVINHSFNQNTSFNYTIIATDDSGISEYWLNETLRFNINDSGYMYNSTGTDYWGYTYLTVFVNDTRGNIANASFYILSIHPPAEQRKLLTFMNSSDHVNGWVDNLGTFYIKDLIINNTQTPPSNSSSCTRGLVTYDSNYMYICVNTNTWKRAGLGW